MSSIICSPNSGHRKNSYRNLCRNLYAVVMKPKRMLLCCFFYW